MSAIRKGGLQISRPILYQFCQRTTPEPHSETSFRGVALWRRSGFKFEQNHENVNVDETPSYIDLARVHRVLRGQICFTPSRICVLLVLFNRNRNVRVPLLSLRGFLV